MGKSFKGKQMRGTMTIRLTILCENSVARPFGLLGEDGCFACYLGKTQGADIEMGK